MKIKERDGQLLIELLIALFVGGMFILGATLGVTSIVRYSFETKGNQIASGFANDQLNDVKSLTDTGWHNIYDLNKGTTYHYYLSQRASSSVVVGGDESMLDNDVQANLIGQWKFDEDTGTTTYDSSGNGNDGTLINNPTRALPANCIAGSCLNFSGVNDYVSVGSAFTSLLNGASSITISGWYKLNVVNVDDGLFAIQSSGDGDWFWNVRPGGTYFWIGYKTSNGLGYRQINNLFLSEVGNWVYLTTTYSNGHLKTYKNGVLLDDFTGVTGSVAVGTSTILEIGGYAAPGVYTMSGSIDDFRIYNRELTADEISKLYNSSVYTRYFSVENVNRDTNGNIASSGGTDDPSTQKITTTVTWEGGRKIQLFHYMLRKDAFLLWNNNWSGGSGVSGPVTSATSSFASSTNVVYTTPSLITVNSTSTVGWVESATFDTQVVGGGAVNSVLWQGTQPAGTSVQFQLAGSNNSTGPWSYIGYDGSGSTYFSPASPNVSVSVTNFNNFRYFRYKLFLNPYGNSGPTVTDAIVNWSK
ncbi:MAG: LamG domain-containing protein [Patescibacteria group bacterium]|nr:LamG domain-containing protein [Patescibacteria group bacterium]